MDPIDAATSGSAPVSSCKFGSSSEVSRGYSAPPGSTYSNLRIIVLCSALHGRQGVSIELSWHCGRGEESQTSDSGHDDSDSRHAMGEALVAVSMLCCGTEACAIHHDDVGAHLEQYRLCCWVATLRRARRNCTAAMPARPMMNETSCRWYALRLPCSGCRIRDATSLARSSMPWAQH